MKRSAVAGTVMLLMITAGCQPKTQQYNLRGQVLAKNEAASEITVKHEDIPGFMPAMTMPYKVKNSAAVQEVQPGDLIAADLITANQGKEYWLEDVRILDESGRKTAKPAVARHVLQVGESVPDLQLINQDGKHFSLSSFMGKAVLVTFIYTRCPMPAFCPRLSSQFSKIHEALAKTPDDYDKTHLLTISFDPKYDTPPVLRKYGLAYLDNHAEGFEHWDFASADPAEMRKIADSFGLQYFEEDNQISHSMDIVLIAPGGTVARYWATEWTAAELEDALRRESKSASADSSPGHHEVNR